MGSSKQIASREVMQLVILLQQGGLFWMLPVMLVHKNGTAGLLALLPGLAAGIVILQICLFWRSRFPERPFVQSLLMVFGRLGGSVLGIVLMLWYLAFAVICLSAFTEVLHTQLLTETPRVVLLLPVFVLAGWLAWNGLEDLARLTPFALCSALLLFILAATGSIGSFSAENLLPLFSGGSWVSAVGCSLFAYSSFLVFFMVYPAVNNTRKLVWKMPVAAVFSAAVFLFWTVLALGVFGQFSMGKLVWLPLELARMIQVSSFLERTEALIVMFWLPLVLVNGALFLWSVSQTAHQLLKKEKRPWLHWLLVAAAALAGAAVDNLMQLFCLEQILASITAGVLPLILLLLLTGIVWHKHRKGAEDDEHVAST